MRNRYIFWLVVILGIVYIGSNLLISPEESALTRYGLTETEATLLALTVTLPVVAIWFIAYYGWSNISRYSRTLKDADEGSAFRKISGGLLGLVLWLPISSALGTVTRMIYSNNENLTAPLVIATNYINLLVLLLAAFLLSKGALELKSKTKNQTKWPLANPGLVLLIVLSFIYVYVTLSNPYRQYPMQNGEAAYYLPDWLLSSTIIFPYLIVFYLGFRAVQYIHVYKQSVSGVIYKNALKYIANGIAVSLIAILAIRLLVSMNSAFEGETLKVILTILYLLVAVIAAGFWLIAKGAKRLQKIEEI